MSLDDLEDLICLSIEKFIKIPRKNLKHFSLILVVPDQFNKIHTRLIVNTLFERACFKSILLHQESVLATYAMALQTACVVDIGATKTTVCCIEEGIILSKTYVRKDFGGDDQTEMLIRLLRSKFS